MKSKAETFSPKDGLERLEVRAELLGFGTFLLFMGSQPMKIILGWVSNTTVVSGSSWSGAGAQARAPGWDFGFRRLQ